MKQPLGIIGAGGFGREVWEYAGDLEADGWQFVAEGFFDDDPPAQTSETLPVLGSIADLERSGITHVLVGVGEPETRRRLAQQAVGWGKSLVSLVHPTAYVSSTATIGAGAVLCPFTMVAAHARLGANSAVNVYGSVGHDSQMGADCVVSPYVAILGTVTVGDCCFLGTHAVIAPGVDLGSHSKVMANSFVQRDAPAGSLLAGSPAKGRVMFRVSEGQG